MNVSFDFSSSKTFVNSGLLELAPLITSEYTSLQPDFFNNLICWSSDSH